MKGGSTILLSIHVQKATSALLSVRLLPQLLAQLAHIEIQLEQVTNLIVGFAQLVISVLRVLSSPNRVTQDIHVPKDPLSPQHVLQALTAQR